MTAKQRVSGPVIAVVLVAVGVVAYLAFNRPELAPPGVGLHDHGEEEAAAPELPWSPPASSEDLQELSIGLMPLGATAVFPPLAEDRGAGVRIALVRVGSPAASAGLRPGDLVKRFGEWTMTQPYSLVGALELVEPDKEYEVMVVRAGEERTLVVTGLRPLPPEERVR